MSARRQARLESFGEMPSEAGKPPRELFDPGHPLWQDRERYLRLMARRGWALPVTERLGMETHPGNRRNYASAAWGEENGIESQPGHADWNRLREMGLVGWSALSKATA